MMAATAACGGGGMTFDSVVNSPGGGSHDPHTKLVNVKVTVTIPAQKKRTRIDPDYISVNTGSLVIGLASVNGVGVTGVNPTVINTLAHSHGCKANAGATVCSATALGSPGNDVFAVTTYAATNADGAVLSVGTVQAQIGQSGGSTQISNTLPLTLGGVIAGLKLSLFPAGAKRGKAARATVTLLAFDASGAQIVGPSDYENPIALQIQGDTDNAFSLHANGKTGASLTIAKPTSNIILTYDGNSQASPITLAATTSGSVGKSANFALHGKTPPPPVGTIYALNFGTNSGQTATVTEYDGTAKGNATPERTLQLSSKLYARSIAVDASGNLYVGYFDTPVGSQPSGTPDKGNEIAVYAPGASGSASPTFTITSDQNSQTAIFPAYMTFDPSGDLVTYGSTGVDGNGGNDAVLTYSPGSMGAVAPAYGWAFVAPLLTYPGPTGLAIDASGNFYVNGALHTSLGPSYGTFVAPAADIGNPAVNPSRTIPWNYSNTQLPPLFTTDVAIDASGEPFIANSVTQGSGSSTSCQGNANVYSASPSGGVTNVPPLRVLTLGGVLTKNSQCGNPTYPLVPYFPSITLFGTILFVADDFNNAIDAYKASAHGNVQPSLQITGSATGLNAPIAVVITSASGQAKARPAQSL